MLPVESAEPHAEVPPVEAPMAASTGALIMHPDTTSGYETARLRFFRDLFEGERLRILVELSALTENFNERMTQGLERRLFDRLVREGHLESIKTMIVQLIDERKSGARS